MKNNTLRKKWWIIGGVGTAAAALVVLLIILLIPKEEIPTFGLKSGMSREEVKAVMEKNGMICVADRVDSDRLIFTGKTALFGKQPSLVSVIPDQGEIIFGFCDETYANLYTSFALQTKYSDLRSLYGEMCTAAVKKLGDPKEETTDGAVWEKDGIRWEIHDNIDNAWYFHFSVCLK